MSESEYSQQYSEQIRWHGYPGEWGLDKDDEDQLQADIADSKRIVKYLERRLEIGTQSSSPQIKE